MIVITESVSNVSEFLTEIFEMLWTNKLINTNVLISDGSSFWSLYTFMPYQIDCTILTQRKIATFSPLNYTNIMYTEEIYPQKLKNFNKCPMYIAASILEPFVIKQKIFDGQIEFIGIDILIIEQFSKLLNFSIVHKYSSTHSGRGVVYENGTATENMGLLLNGDVNLTIGGYLLSVERTKFLSFGNPYLQVKMTFAFKERDAWIESIGRFTAPFDSCIWFLMGGILIFAVLILLLTKKLSRKWRHFYIGGRKNRSPIQNMWATTLGISIANQHILSGNFFGTFARTLFLLWTILWLIIRSAYQGALYEQLQRQQITSPYDTVDKIASSNCKIVARAHSAIVLKKFFNPDR